ncbi:MAG TPA: HEAT repeat domain-containing protein [Cyclobacteriaceae bacterium]
MDKVQSEIRKLEDSGDIDKLAEYLMDLAKYDENPMKYENEFRKHLDSSYWHLRKTAVFCLMFILQIDNSEYRNQAIKFVKDKNEDEEVRRWAASGLAQTYQKTKDKELLKVFIEIIDDDNDHTIKESLMNTALLVFGITSRERVLRSNKGVIPTLQDLFSSFQMELTEIREIIK